MNDSISETYFVFMPSDYRVNDKWVERWEYFGEYDIKHPYHGIDFIYHRAVLKKENSVDAPNVAESYYDIVYVDDYTRDKVGGWKMLNTGEQIEIYRQRQIKFTTPKAGYYKLSTVTGEAPITEMWVDVR